MVSKERWTIAHNNGGPWSRPTRNWAYLRCELLTEYEAQLTLSVILNFCKWVQNLINWQILTTFNPLCILHRDSLPIFLHNYAFLCGFLLTRNKTLWHSSDIGAAHCLYTSSFVEVSDQKVFTKFLVIKSKLSKYSGCISKHWITRNSSHKCLQIYLLIQSRLLFSVCTNLK